MDRDVHDKFIELSEQINDLTVKVENFGKRLEKPKEDDLGKSEIMVELEEMKSRLKNLTDGKLTSLPAAKKKRIVKSVKKKKTTAKTTNE